MASAPEQPQMKKTLGLTGLTMNAMALIAPGAFLWLTFAQQSQYGAPMAGSAIWFGILAALLLCFATAISYAELSKLYPGAGSSYFFAEQAFLSKTNAYKFARISKFVIGWASHLYYWLYPGVMVGVTAILVGYLAGQLFPDTFNGTINSPTLMIGFCILFSFGVAYIAYRGVTGTTGVNIAINIIQITALLIFSVIALGYRLNHGEGSVGYTLDPDGKPIQVVLANGPDGKPIKDEKTGEYKVEQENGARQAADADLQGRRDHPGASRHRQAGRREASHLPIPRDGRLGGCTAFVQLRDHSGLHRHPDPGGFRVGHLDGRRGQERQARHSAGRVALAVHPGRGVLPDRVLLRRLLPQPRLHDDHGRRLQRPDRRHDGDRRHLAVRQPGGRLVVHVHPGDHRVPGPGRHHALLHVHGRPGDLRHGPRRRGALALRHVARQEPDAAPGHLDVGRASRRWWASSPS